MFNYGENGFPSKFFLNSYAHMHIFSLYLWTLFFFFFSEAVSPCVALAGLKLYVDQARLETTEIHLPYPPLCWDLKACVIMPP